MKKLFVVMSTALLMLGVGTSRSFASDPTVQEYSFENNETGTGSCCYIDSGDGAALSGELSAAGISLSGYNTTSGLGTISYTVQNTGASSITSFFDVFIDEEVSTPFINEYGSTNGSPSTGEGWEIGSNTDPSTIFSDFESGTLQNANLLRAGDQSPPKSMRLRL